MNEFERAPVVFLMLICTALLWLFAWGVKSFAVWLSNSMPLVPFLGLSALIILGILLIARVVDQRDARLRAKQPPDY